MRECAWQHLSHEGLTLEDALDITLERLFSGPKLMARCVWIKEKQGEGDQDKRQRQRQREKKDFNQYCIMEKLKQSLFV